MGMTDMFMKKFGLDYDELTQMDDTYKHKETVENIAKALKEVGYAYLDYDNIFYGENSDMRFSELWEIAKANGVKQVQ